MSVAEVIYVGDYNNTIDLRLENKGIPLDLSSATQITANITGTIVVSTNQPSDLVRWNQPGYETGEIRLQLGSITGISTGVFDLWITLFDILHSNGVVFPAIPVLVYDLPGVA